LMGVCLQCITRDDVGGTSNESIVSGCGRSLHGDEGEEGEEEGGGLVTHDEWSC